MRGVLVPAVLLVAGLAGCVDGEDVTEAFDRTRDAAECLGADDGELAYHFGPGHSLSRQPPAGAGSEVGNAFSSAFLTNDLKEWLSEPLVGGGLRIEGTVTLEYWAQSVGTPAPVALGGDPGEAYHFFNQLGSDVAMQPSYVVQYAEALPAPGTIRHYVHEFEMPAGGFVVEAGDRLRVLLTSLVLDGPDGGGHVIHYGGEMPSQVRFEADCYAARDWGEAAAPLAEAITLPANQGLLAGAVPATEDINQAHVPFDLHADTERLTVRVRQDASSPNPVKDDIDVAIVDADGEPVYSASTPYSDETLRLWEGNLEALAPPGRYQVRVDSYSGVAYSGQVEVVQERRT